MSETLQWKETELLAEVERRSGTPVSACFQCHKCSTGCPISPEMDFLSSQVIRLIHLGEEEELLGSRAIWLCASCDTCSSRCPMDIDFAAVTDALRVLAVKRSGIKTKDTPALFNRAFLSSIKRFGRAYDMGMVASYKFRSRNFMADTEKFPKMLLKRKLAILPSLGGNRKAVKRIFNKTLKNKGPKE